MSEPSIPNGDLRPAAAAEYPELAQPAPGYAFPPGTPAEVPADFAKAREDLLAGQLTAEEIAEFRALRAEKKANDARVAAEAAEAAARLSPPTHFVHLADGSVVDGSPIATHWATEAGQLLTVAGAHLKPEFVSLPL